MSSIHKKNPVWVGFRMGFSVGFLFTGIIPGYLVQEFILLLLTCLGNSDRLKLKNIFYFVVKMMLIQGFVEYCFHAQFFGYI